MPTQKEVVEEERMKAHSAGLSAGFTTAELHGLELFVRHIIAATNLEDMDARLIEGDDELEIRGY